MKQSGTKRGLKALVRANKLEAVLLAIELCVFVWALLTVIFTTTSSNASGWEPLGAALWLMILYVLIGVVAIVRIIWGLTNHKQIKPALLLLLSLPVLFLVFQYASIWIFHLSSP